MRSVGVELHLQQEEIECEFVHIDGFPCFSCSFAQGVLGIYSHQNRPSSAYHLLRQHHLPVEALVIQ